MEEYTASNWAEFESAIESVRAKYGTFRTFLLNGEKYERPNLILFRGQGSSKWKLETTLERRSKKQYNIKSYVSLALMAKNELESFTGKRWETPSFPELDQIIKDAHEVFTARLPAYELLVYLRHHGFPSPLLDWSESPYIAAFFAYQQETDDDPAIYCYIERPGSAKGGLGGEPFISLQGPYVSTHHRHFAQKAWYTIATQWSYTKCEHQFCPHDAVFSQNSSRQDILVKIKLPRNARIDALKRLNDYNINHFTLFQSEDALVKAIEQKYFDLQKQ